MHPPPTSRPTRIAAVTSNKSMEIGGDALDISDLEAAIRTRGNRFNMVCCRYNNNLAVFVSVARDFDVVSEMFEFVSMGP